MKNRFLSCALIALAGLMITAGTSQAFGRVSFGIGFGYGPYYGPAYYPYASYYAPYYYYAPRVVYAPPPVVYVQPATYVAPAPTYVERAVFSAPAPTVTNQAADIVVRLADPNAQLFFDGTLTRQTGVERRFHTPPLVAGANNTYTIRIVSPASGVTEERRVRVTPGQTSVVDFTRLGSESIPVPR